MYPYYMMIISPYLYHCRFWNVPERVRVRKVGRYATRVSERSRTDVDAVTCARASMVTCVTGRTDVTQPRTCTVTEQGSVEVGGIPVCVCFTARRQCHLELSSVSRDTRAQCPINAVCLFICLCFTNHCPYQCINKKAHSSRR